LFNFSGHPREKKMKKCRGRKGVGSGGGDEEEEKE